MLRSELLAKLRELQRTGEGDLAHLPSRFPLRVSHADRELLDRYMDADELGALEVSSDYELLWPGHGVLGRFSRREAAILKRLGLWLAIYQARVLEIARSGWVAVELVRPLLSVCRKCDRVYPAGFRRCERDHSVLLDEQGIAAHVDFMDLREQLQRQQDK